MFCTLPYTLRNNNFSDDPVFRFHLTMIPTKLLAISSLVLCTRSFTLAKKSAFKLSASMAHSVIDDAFIALCQVHVTSDKQKNIAHVEEVITSAVEKAPKSISVLVLPEIWNSPYAASSFSTYAEFIPNEGELPSEELSPSIAKLSELAKKLNIWIIGGSIPEYVDVVETVNEPKRASKRNIYNTCVVVNPEGSIVAKHRKLHLFDIDIPGKMTFRESDSLTGGSSVTVIDSPWGKIGVGICYDIRFPELAILMRQRGCRLLVYPGAFNLVTGPAHWELLQRGRAVDNQLFVAACSPARDTTAGYVAWGHSTVVSPWGDVLAKAGEHEEVVYADLDFRKVTEMRQNIPVSHQKRLDLYELVDAKSRIIE